MNGQKWSLKGRGIATLIGALLLAVLGLGGSSALADEPIVGYWQVTFKDASTGEVVLHVWEAWHSDRTEMQNVSANPIGGNVCQGVWVPLGQRTYGLNHPAFLFFVEGEFPFPSEDQEGQLESVSIDILARVAVDKSADTFAGTGIIKVIDGIDPLDPSASVLATQNLIITGKRVKVDVSQLPPA
jgi:hypothetical protein